MRRSASLVERLLLVSIAALVCAWLVAGWLASRELDEAGDLVSSARLQPISDAELADTREGLERARRFNADDASLYAEIGLLVVAGRADEALPVAERLVRLQPERFEAWRSLYGLTGTTDPERANLARRRALELNPRAAPAIPRVPPSG